MIFIRKQYLADFAYVKNIALRYFNNKCKNDVRRCCIGAETKKLVVYYIYIYIYQYVKYVNIIILFNIVNIS